MSTTRTTPNLKLNQPALGATQAGLRPLNANAAILDGLAPLGGLYVSPHEVPSASLNVDVAPGSIILRDGTTFNYLGAVAHTMVKSTTSVLYLDGTAAWALTGAPAYPTTQHVKLATVVAGASTITSIIDNRQCFVVAGT